MNRLTFNYIIMVIAFFGAFQVFCAELTVSSVFSDHMVLQRDVKVPIWGWAEPGDKITVRLEYEKKTAVTDKDGKWVVILNKHKAGGPFEISITGNNLIILRDVYFGEVWLCSGQSNMQMLLGKSERSWIAGGITDFEKEIADSDYPQIRMLTVPFDDKTMVFKPKKDSGGNWIVCSPQTSGKFAAIPFLFARIIHQKLKVPVGLLNVTLGGSCVEAWISNDSARNEPGMKTTMSEWDTAWDEYQKSLKNITPAVNPINHRSTPTVLYNGMLAPFVPYAMKGVIWYQGEANAAKPDKYADHFMTLIRDWRRQWGIGDFPFLYVQLAPIGGESYSGLREAQRQALELPNTAMVVCIDTDSGLHPLNKKPVADRLAMAARALAYGEKIEYSGPLPVVATATDSIASITFSHIGAGLSSVDGGELKSFEIAGADGVYLPATARIDGDKIMVSSVKILNPVAVRYGWRDGLIRNLVNKNGLPASPFCINIKKGG